MEEIIFRRILHPVGHGAFFTEQLKKVDDKERERSFLNVVYDCGATARRSNIPSLIKEETKITFNEEEHIDLLFISHFDEDHTNGLEYLLEHTRMDKDTYVIIPFRFPYIIMIMDDRFPSLARFVDMARQNGVKFVGVSGNGMEQRIENKDNLDNSDGKVVLLDKNNMFTAWDVEMKRPLWYFYPFMIVDVNSLQSKFERAISEDTCLCDVNFDNPDEVIVHRDELKKIYQGIGRTKDNVTRINVNSLLMLSFPASIKSYDYFCKAGHYTIYDVDYRATPGVYVDLGITCLYTGDSVLESNDIDKINQHAVKIMSCLSGIDRIHLLQIPHHGSLHSFSPSLLSVLKDKTLSVFVNGNPYRKWYRGYKKLTREAIRNRLPLYIVSNNFHSRIDTILFF